jgi:HrpA-like RNA helicase
MYCVENHQIVIVVGQTGCGKTTRMLRSDFLQRFQ